MEPWSQPEIVDYGELSDLTRNSPEIEHLGLRTATAGSSPVTPSGDPGGGGGGGGGTLGATLFAPTGGAIPAGDASVGPGGGGDVAGIEAAGQVNAASGGGGGGTVAGPAGSALPFTGFGAGIAALVGSGLVASGALLRRATRPVRRQD